MTPTVATVLRALADLAPASPRRVLDVTRPGQPLIWLSQPDRCPPSREVERLAAADLLHADERTLRRAWGLVAGAIEVDGVRRRVRLPLVSEPVRLERRLRGYRVVSAGDLEITPLVEDRAHAARLEVLARVEQIRRAETVEQMVAARGPGTPDWISAPGTEEWLRAVAEAASLPVTEVDRTVRAGPATLPTRGLVLYVATALFSVRDVAGVGLADGLRAWAGRPGLDQTALATVYGLRSDPTSETDRAVPSTDVTAAAAGPDGAVVGRGGGDATEPVRSPMPLNETQIELIRRVRHQPLTVLSGPPGNGKSHAVVAAAIDAVDRGGSVLVVTQSSHAADVLADLLQRYPGPVPVLFGDAERREAIAQILGRGPTDDVVGNDVLAAAEAAVARAAVEVDRITAELIRLLELERLAESVPRWEPRLPGLRLDVPGVFAAGVDLDAFPATPEPPAPPVVITMVSRMLWSKGPDILVQAHDLLMKRGIACRLQLVGDTDPENPAGIPADLLRAWNSRPGVSWLGHRADIADIWRRSQIAVLPSRGGEGLPRALIEAAASARPIVTTDVPGCNRIVKNGKNGLVVPPEDPEALADALQRLVADRALRERYGAAGRMIVKRGFSLRHVTDAVTSVYKELLSRDQGKADPSGHAGQVSTQ